MGFLGDIVASASYGQRTDLENPALWLLDAFGGGTTTRAGERVTPSSAMRLPAVVACIRNISEDVAKFPVEERQKRVGRRGSDPVPDGAAGELLDGEFNPGLLSFTGRETLTSWALGWGRGYAEIERGGAGRPVALWPIHPSRSRLVRIEGELYLEVHQQDLGAPTGVVHIPYADVLHIRGFGDEQEGLGLIQMAAESIGVGLAAQSFAATFFGNGAHASGVISWPKDISAPDEKAIRKIKKQWSKLHGKHANEPATLLDGATWTQTTVPPEAAQFLETRKFQTVEFCRITRMPLHMVQDLDRGTFSNIEHLRIEYVQDCLGAWIIRWEKEAGRKLLTQAERKSGRYVKHNLGALLRGDFASRSAGYRTLISSMVMTPNEARDLEDVNPSDEEGADMLWTQGAMVPMKLAAEGKTAATGAGTPAPGATAEDTLAAQPPVPPGREADVGALRPVIDYAAQTLIRKEAMATSRAAKRMPARRDYDVWAARFAKDLRGDMAETFRPVLLACDNSQADLSPAFDAWERRFTARGGAEFGIDEEASRLAGDVARLIAEDKA